MNYKILVLFLLLGGLLGFLYVDLGFMSNTFIKNPIGIFSFLGSIIGIFIGLVYNYIMCYLR